MTDFPVIFSKPMILALLRGIERPGTGKTMTRRLAWGSPFGTDVDDLGANDMRADGYKVSGPDDTDHRIVWPPSPLAISTPVRSRIKCEPWIEAGTSRSSWYRARKVA